MDWLLRACLLLSMAGLGLHAGGQQPPPDQKPRNPAQAIRVDVNLVQTDVMVFDRAGRFVDDLQREQFELHVDGKPQPVAFVELVSTGSPDEGKRWSRFDLPAGLYNLEIRVTDRVTNSSAVERASLTIH